MESNTAVLLDLSSGQAKRRREIPILLSSENVISQSHTSNCLYGAPILHPRSLPIFSTSFSKIDKPPLLKEPYMSLLYKQQLVIIK